MVLCFCTENVYLGGADFDQLLTMIRSLENTRHPNIQQALTEALRSAFDPAQVGQISATELSHVCLIHIF